MLTNYFSNYELIKLQISSPFLNYLIIIFIFLILSIISLKRVESTQLLDKLQSNQLKGMGILFVIIVHLYTHVSIEFPRIIMIVNPSPIFLFLLLSGFGLTISLNKQFVTYTNYFKRRILKVMIPYWITTIIILFLDYLLLDRVYTSRDLITTFAGINISTETLHIDYVRWYITLQLFWYIIFFIFNKYLSFFKTLIFLIICIIAGIVFSRISSGMGSGVEIAFPVGCLIGKYYNKIILIFEKKTSYFFISAIILLILYIFYDRFFSYDYFKNIELSNIIFKAIRFIALKGMDNIFNMFTCFAFIIFIGAIGKINYTSKFLNFCGTISYEIFLLHGCFLIKYNFIFPFFDVKLISVSFFLYFIVLIIISFFFHKIINRFVIRF